jgi:hypothetical protein
VGGCRCSAAAPSEAPPQEWAAFPGLRSYGRRSALGRGRRLDRLSLARTHAAQLDSLVLGGDGGVGSGRFLFGDLLFQHGLMLLRPSGFRAFEGLKGQGAGINLGGCGFRCFRGRGKNLFLRHGFLFWRCFDTDRFFDEGGFGCGRGLGFGTFLVHCFEYRTDTLVVNGRGVTFDLDPHVGEFFHQFFVGQPDLFR